MADAPCVAAGFFVTKAVARGDDRSPDLLPPTLVSLSPCIAPSYQLYWGWEAEKHRAEAVAFGLAEDRLSELEPWGRGHAISYPNVFHSLADARALVAEFLPTREDVFILGAALPAALREEFLVVNRQSVYDAVAETSREALFGVNQVLTAAAALPEGGERLGFEIVLYDYNLACSWLCTRTERAVFEALGIALNAHGLVETYDDALRAHAWLGDHPEEGEPGPYYPWLLVRYSAR